jgi:hypothetical protein
MRAGFHAPGDVRRHSARPKSGLSAFSTYWTSRARGPGRADFYIQEDKALTKKLLAFDGVGWPDYAAFNRDANLETGENLRLPLFVKPLHMDGSIGIDSKSLDGIAIETVPKGTPHSVDR